MMHEPEKSDSVVVATKPTNKAEQSAAEPVERRTGTKGNAGQQSTRRAQDRASVSQALSRVRKVAQERKTEKFTTLFHHLDSSMLRTAFFALKKDAAPGVDGLTWKPTRPISIHGSKTCTHGFIEERIGRSLPGDGLFRSRTVHSAR